MSRSRETLYIFLLLVPPDANVNDCLISCQKRNQIKYITVEIPALLNITVLLFKTDILDAHDKSMYQLLRIVGRKRNLTGKESNSYA